MNGMYIYLDRILILRLDEKFNEKACTYIYTYISKVCQHFCLRIQSSKYKRKKITIISFIIFIYAFGL